LVSYNVGIEIFYQRILIHIIKLKIKIDPQLFYEQTIIGVTNMVDMGELHVSFLGFEIKERTLKKNVTLLKIRKCVFVKIITL